MTSRSAPARGSIIYVTTQRARVTSGLFLIAKNIKTCCAQEVKEYLDAEHLTPYPTSEVPRTPLNVEMQSLKPEADSTPATGGGGQWRSRNEVGSVDSSDTYISCKSQPFHSQGDLTAADDAVFEPPAATGPPAENGSGNGGGVNDSNLYVNPLETSNGKGGPPRSLGTSPMEECKEFGGRTAATGSRGSLNETVKRRKTRFSQVSPELRKGHVTTRFYGIAMKAIFCKFKRR